jgi:hypothetical protein
MIESDHPHLCEDDPIAPSQPFWFYPLSAAKVEMKKKSKTAKKMKIDLRVLKLVTDPNEWQPHWKPWKT